MFATRTDQENLAYSHQQAAASKPLNQGARGLESKTPANKQLKTPFRGNKQDENNVFLPGKTGLKTGGKAKENIFTTVKKGNGNEKDAFVTPAGPRTRAPLGMKTTNAKATAFQTPAPTNGKNSIKSTQKPASPRLRRAKVKIHQAEATPLEDDAEPEIEYMAPKSIPLPDHPDTLHNLDYAKIFNRDNLVRDLYTPAPNSVDARGQTASDRAFEAELSHASELNDRQIRAALAKDPIFGTMFSTITSTSPAPPKKGPSTLASRTAAAALSKPTQPSFAAPTAATKARAPSSTIGSRKTIMPLREETTNHAVATAASKSTLGYANGRRVSASARKPLSFAHRAEVVKKPAVETPKVGLEYLLAEEIDVTGLLTGEASEDEDEGVGEIGKGMDGLDMDEEEDEGLKDFELDVPVF